jgi:hypothetical protein
VRRTSRKVTAKSRPLLPGARKRLPETDAAAIAVCDAFDASTVSVSNLSLHELFEQQARSMLDRADIDEEQKQSILVAMACPCCGAGGMSFSVTLKAEEL